jgi:hypothetical protein
MFTKDSIVLFELIRFSKEGVCFVETHSNDTIPMRNVVTEEVGEKLWLRGLDAFNDWENQVEATTISGFTGLDNPSNPMVGIVKNDYDNLKELCLEENLEVKKEYFYKNLPVYQRAISLCLDKHYETLTLNELKEFWKQSVEKYCFAFETHITSELQDESAKLHEDELQAIRDMFSAIRQHEEISSFNTKEELLSFWPVLLMPAPLFVKPGLE